METFGIEPPAIDFAQWISFIVLPPIGVLFFLWWRHSERIGRLYGALDSFKLEVAKTYTTQEHLKDVEDRILDILKEIKADVRALRNSGTAPPSRQ